MAREPSVLEDEVATANHRSDADRDSNTELLDRRDYLKLAGAATAGAIGTVASAGASAADFTTITVSAGERRVIDLDDGETFENVLIDQTASGAAATIDAIGTNITVRNVAFSGRFDHDGRAIGAGDTGGGHSVIENVYLGDGVDSSIGDARHPKLGIWVTPDHSGTLEIKRTYIADANDNAFYCSAPGSNGNGQRGDVHLENCYAENCRVSSFRISRGTVTNCTAVGGRVLWVWPTDYHGDAVVVRDCDLDAGGYAHGYDFGRDGRTTEAEVYDTDYASSDTKRTLGTVHLHEENVGHDPDTSVPEGCPDSVEAVFDGAYDGGDGGDVDETDDVDLDELTEIHMMGEGDYRIDVDGDIYPYPDFEQYLTFGESHGGDWAEWFLQGSETWWYVDGEITNFEIDGDIDIEIDGEPTTVEEILGEDENPDDQDPAAYREHTLEFRGDLQGEDWESTDYAFEVDGELEPSEYNNASIDPELEIEADDTRVEHTIANWRDAFAFDGELIDLELDGPAQVLLDGEEITPDDVGEDQLSNVILIDGDDADVTRYEFEVSGEVEKSTYEGASIDDEDVIDGNEVHGVVANWRDAFRFSGELEQLTVDGPGTIYLNDEVVDPDDYGQSLPHTVEVIGQGPFASFELSVDGTIEYDGDDSAEDVTVISGSTVESSVTDDTQRFHFSGALTDITFTGTLATVTLDGEEIDVHEYGDHDLLPHAIVIDGSEASGSSSYSFEIDGSVLKSDHMGATIDDDDVIEDQTVTGSLDDWLNAYWFEGNISNFTLDGDASVHVEYNARNR